MLREEKGFWHKIYRVLIEFREEAISRVFRHLRSSGGVVKNILSAVTSLFDDKKENIERVMASQFKLIAEKEKDFLTGALDVNMSKYPRTVKTVRDAPLQSGEGSWVSKLFKPVRKRLRKSLQFSISRQGSIEEVVDRVFGKDTPKEIKIGNWRGNEFQGGVLSRLRSSLKTLVTTSFYEMVHKVRKFAFSRAEKVGSIRSVAVLDSRTTETCRNYDGLIFEQKSLKPLGHGLKYIPTPRHWNCRSQHVPAEFDGKKIKPIPFEEWFDDLSNSAQAFLLGKVGGDLYREQQSPLLNLLKRLSPKFLG